MRFNKPTLVLFCGPPGSGKTTLAKDLEAQGHGLRICTDDLQESLGVDHNDDGFHERLQARLYRHALELLDHGQDVVLEDGLFWSVLRLIIEAMVSIIDRRTSEESASASVALSACRVYRMSSLATAGVAMW